MASLIRPCSLDSGNPCRNDGYEIVFCELLKHLPNQEKLNLLP
jgi:hypothetical protein